MKVSINSKFYQGPYGGGVQFANGLKDYLESQGVNVINHLNDPDIDIILHVNPFPFLTGTISAYSFLDAYSYQLKHPQALIVQRVNECDERKNTRHMNKLLVKASQYSDFVVLIGTWLKPLLEKAGLSPAKPTQTIVSGGDTRVFNSDGKVWWDGKEPLKMVTHHWSPSFFKGHDVYQALDKLLDNPEMAKKYQFTYVGARPKDLVYRNTAFIDPLAGKELANELRKHHVYITGSKNDPGPMHPIEAALSGLPILYINSGALPELCRGYGIEFDLEILPEKLEEMRQKYSVFKKALEAYPNTSARMGKDYLDLFKKLIKERQYRKKHGGWYRFCFSLYRIGFGIFWKIKRRFIA